MKRPYLAILSIVLLVSCKEKIQNFIFDASKMNTLSEYVYEYEFGKLKLSKEITYTFMFGQKVDTMETITSYEYDEKGLLRKESSKTDFEELPSVRLFEYNSNDSLIRDIFISSENDTVDWRDFDYFPDGRKIVYSRILHRNMDKFEDLLTSAQKITFDTIIHRMDYQYEKNLCKSMKEYDGKSNLIRTVEYDYNNNKLVKETYFSRIKSIEITEKIKYIDYSKSDKFPDYYSLGMANDTVDYCKNKFINDSLYLTTTVLDHGKLVDRIFYKNDKMIGMIGFSKEMNFKSTEAYSYYENGDLKETKTYSEELRK